MIATTRKRPLLLPALLVAALGGLGSSWLLTRSTPASSGEEAGIEREPMVVAPVGSAGGVPERTAITPPPAREEPGRESLATAPSGRHALTCLRVGTLAPLAGIRLWVGERAITEPSGADGILTIDGELPALVVTAWGEGSVPLELRRDALPERALLEPADGELEVELVHREAEERVKRFELHPHLAAAAREGPWRPALEQLDEDLYRAKRLPPGEYDVYLWVSSGRSAPRPLAARSVKVDAGRRARVRLDAVDAAATDSEKD